MAFLVAIDGPAGAGKSTIAKIVAKELNIVYVDTGAMYRTMALHVLRNNVCGDDEQAVEKVIEDADVSLAYVDGEQQVLLNGENVSSLIRTPEVSEMASKVSAYKNVRKSLVAKQKEMAENTDLVMDGRDIGTCVLPDATLKIYLTASSQVRGERRYKEMLEKGIECNLEEIIKDIEERDMRDMTREESPLKQAEDAVLVDSSYMTIQEVADNILALAKERM